MSAFMTVYGGERLTLTADVSVGELIIHRGPADRQTTLDTGGYRLRFGTMTIVGPGRFVLLVCGEVSLISCGPTDHKVIGDEALR